MDLFIIIYECLTHVILWMCAGFFLFRFKRLDRPFKLLAIYYMIQPLLVSVSTYMAYNSINNYQIHHILIHLEFIFMISAFYHYFKENFIYKFSLLIMSVFYVVFSVLDTMLLEPITIMPSNMILVANIIYILCSLVIFYKLYEKPTVIFLEKEAYFWMGASFLTYFGATIFISLFFNYIAFELPIWVLDIFLALDLLIFLISKLFMVYGAHILTRNRKSNLKLSVE